MKDEFVKLHFDILSGDFIKAGEASSNIKRAFLQLGIRNDIIKRVCVSCYEAEMNIVIHSVGGYMDIFIYENKVEIIANDFGLGIENISLAMKEGYSTANEEAREMGFGAGMGLPNMKKSSDEFEINSVVGQYTHIKMIINFS
jgi:anti-sigma regulatory factor (Ser/Thr protein kinase)